MKSLRLKWLLLPTLLVQVFVNATDLYEFNVPDEIDSPTNRLIIGPSNPDGPQWSANSRYITRDGQPFMPVMGEFHFSRYPAGEWESALLKMKAGGVDIVSTYLFWTHHEEERGVFDFSGQRDIRRFLELCARHDLLVWLRLGPWCHGEVRNGGFPDWLGPLFGVEDGTMTGWGKDDLRTNNAEYLALVDQLFARYAVECRGMMDRDGGPVIGIQVENEYSKSGEGKGEAHIARLIEMAQAHGFLAPFYSVTGWHNAPFPALQCLPMFGGYPAAPWRGNTEKLEPQQVYLFDLQRDAGGIGTDILKPVLDSQRDLSPYPLMNCEIGVGNQISDHRRPWIGTLDGVAPVLTRLGIGAACIGYYVYHGGANPEGRLTTLQESRSTGYPNDYPVKSYDFQAAIRESGRIDDKYHHLRRLHLLMHDFGGALAPTIPILPDRSPQSNDDFTTARMVLRTDGKLGFLFVNNHVRGYPQPEREDVQVRVTLGGREILVPEKPVAIPSSALFIWPVALPMADAVLLYSTAQPLCTLEEGDGTLYVFAQTITDQPEYVFQPDSVQGEESRFSVHPGCDSVLEITTRSGKRIRILTLTTGEALQAYKFADDRQEMLFLSSALLVQTHNQVRLASVGAGRVQLSVTPARKLTSPGLVDEGQVGTFASHSLSLPEFELPDPVVERTGPNTWRINTGTVPEGTRLKIDFLGDVAELHLGNRLVYDWFYYGEPLEVSLDRYREALAAEPLILEIIPMAKDKKVYLDVPRPEGEAVLKGVTLEVEQWIPLTIH